MSRDGIEASMSRVCLRLGLTAALISAGAIAPAAGAQPEGDVIQLDPVTIDG